MVSNIFVVSREFKILDFLFKLNMINNGPLKLLNNEYQFFGS